MALIADRITDSSADFTSFSADPAAGVEFSEAGEAVWHEAEALRLAELRAQGILVVDLKNWWIFTEAGFVPESSLIELGQSLELSRIWGEVEGRGINNVAVGPFLSANGTVDVLPGRRQIFVRPPLEHPESDLFRMRYDYVNGRDAMRQELVGDNWIAEANWDARRAQGWRATNHHEIDGKRTELHTDSHLYELLRQGQVTLGDFAPDGEPHDTLFYRTIYTK